MISFQRFNCEHTQNDQRRGEARSCEVTRIKTHHLWHQMFPETARPIWSEQEHPVQRQSHNHTRYTTARPINDKTIGEEQWTTRRWAWIIEPSVPVAQWESIALAAQRLWVQFPGNSCTDNKYRTWMHCKSVTLKTAVMMLKIQLWSIHTV